MVSMNAGESFIVVGFVVWRFMAFGFLWLMIQMYGGTFHPCKHLIKFFA